MSRHNNQRWFKDLQTLSDLAIYNCSLFGSFKQVIYEDLSQKLVSEYTNIELAREATRLAAGPARAWDREG